MVGKVTQSIRAVETAGSYAVVMLCDVKTVDEDAALCHECIGVYMTWGRVPRVNRPLI